jgi:hypothetical protein
MLNPEKLRDLDSALQGIRFILAESQSALSLVDGFEAELHTLSLSELLDEQLRILDDIKGTWVDEDVIVAAMDALRTLTETQGYVPSESQQERLRAHGFRATDETAMPLKDVRRFARSRH